MPAEPSARERGRRDQVLDSVGRKAARKVRARREGHRVLSSGLSVFGVVGWSVMVPTVIGILVGVWLDARGHDRISWTLTGLLSGMAVGCLMAWTWVQRQSRGN